MSSGSSDYRTSNISPLSLLSAFALGAFAVSSMAVSRPSPFFDGWFIRVVDREQGSSPKPCTIHHTPSVTSKHGYQAPDFETPNTSFGSRTLSPKPQTLNPKTGVSASIIFGSIRLPGDKTFSEHYVCISACGLGEERGKDLGGMRLLNQVILFIDECVRLWRVVCGDAPVAEEGADQHPFTDICIH